MKLHYRDLRNGDLIVVQGHLLIAQNVRAAGFDPLKGDLIRFEGVVAVEGDDIFGTGYDGGTYGAYASVSAAIVRKVER